MKGIHRKIVMSVNSYSSSPLPSNSSSINTYHFLQKCFDTTAGAFSITAFTVTSILLVLPLCIYVIYLGFQRMWQQRSGSKMSHFDIITFHMVFIELVNILGSVIFCYGVLTHHPEVMVVGMCFFGINVSIQQFYHTLSCVERYLAVVHPVTYMGLKKGKGIRIRNISIGCVWLLSIADTVFLFMEDDQFITIYSYCTSSIIFLVISFCSLSVLYVLVRPGPGAEGEGRQRVGQSKMRAFYTIMAILGVLLMRVMVITIHSVLLGSPHVGETERCGVFLSMAWLTLPSSLVLPLLFLNRAGKLLCCKNINTSGQASD
ncbi:uncharacterized protein [Clinocottus analis]|uniref:uncharacterized protein isoform X4 n=1 Tax=Clinocottus analis TaxID=304258 RepID=UPI0035BF559D